MIALLASTILTVYLLVPNVIFRLFFNRLIPMKNYARTKTEEITTAVLVSLVPFTLVLAITLHGSAAPSAQTWAHYKTLLFALFVGSQAAGLNKDTLWALTSGLLAAHSRFLGWYWLSVVLEATLLGILGRSYGSLYGLPYAGRLYRRFADAFILPLISEWHILLTPFIFPAGTRIEVDVLTSDDHLYRGEGEPFVNKDGELHMVMIEKASRFDRRGYLREVNLKNNPNPALYWKPIPGKKLYVFAGKITNINVRYEAPSVLPAYIQELLRKVRERIPVQVSEIVPES